MTDDVCGAETNAGDPCQNPAGSCPHHEHGGRPSKFTEERVETLLDAARSGMTVEGCARAAGIGESTLHDWRNEHSEFSEAFNRARAEGERRLVDDVAADDPKFILERSYGYTKTEKREVEHTGEGGGPLEVIIGGDSTDE